MTGTHGYTHPHLYDLASDHLGPHQPDVRFYLGHASRAGRALEVGADTGRIAVELAAEGVHVHCVEPSATMRSAILTKAAQRPEVHPILTVLPAEGADFDLGGKVPLAYAAGVLQHFLTDEEVLAMLGNVRRHLEPGGLFLFDAMGAQESEDVPATIMGEQQIGEVLYRKTFETRILSTDYYKFDISYETFHAGRLVESAEGHSVGRFVRREAMHDLLKKAGFEVDAEVMAYDGSPSTGREDRVVIGAKRT